MGAEFWQYSTERGNQSKNIAKTRPVLSILILNNLISVLISEMGPHYGYPTIDGWKYYRIRPCWQKIPTLTLTGNTGSLL